MCEDNFIPRADDINPTDSVIIAWLLKKEVSVPDDDIIYEKAVDDVALNQKPRSMNNQAAGKSRFISFLPHHSHTAYARSAPHCPCFR